MKKATPQLAPPSQPVLEPEVPIIVEPTPLVEPKFDLTQMPELATMMEPAAMVAPTTMVEPEAIVAPATMVEPEAMVAPAPMAGPEPFVEPEPVPKEDPAQELAISSPSAREDIRILHKYLDPFLPTEPGPPEFQPYLGEFILWRIAYLLPIPSFARSAARGLHHHLLETCLDDFSYIKSRTSFSQQGSLMRSSSANGWANPTF